VLESQAEHTAMPILDKIKNVVKSPRTIVVAGVVIVITLIAGLVKLGVFRALIHSPWFPEIVVGLVLIIVLLIVFVGIPWYREYSFVQRLESGYRVGGEQSPQEFQAKFTAALRQFRNLPQHAGKGDPSYALPWFLIIGAGASGKTEAIKSSGIFAALSSTATEGATQNCDWWVSNSMLLLDTAGRYTIPSDVERDRGEWYRLLRLIDHYHGREPLSGMIVAVAADYLATQSDEKLRADAGQVRQRIEEAIQELEFDFPLYILLTKCDLLEGFSEFFGALPIRVLNQAVGWIDDPPAGIAGGPARGATAFRRLQDGLRSTYERLNVLGTSVLNGKVAEELRQPLFCFPEEFHALVSRMAVFAEPLWSEDVRYHTPLLRGIFLSSASQQGPRTSFLRKEVAIESQPTASESKAPVSYFLRGLFETILPRDRVLARSEASKAAA
jgi:type VI secretion system protein ImpL